MPDIWIGRVGDFSEGECKVLQVDDREVGVFHFDGGYYAYENRCLHQGGPACEGVTIGKVEAVLREDRGVLTERFSQAEQHFVCPWHGWEYDVRTGECAGNRNLRLKNYEVKRVGEELYLVL